MEVRQGHDGNHRPYSAVQVGGGRQGDVFASIPTMATEMRERIILNYKICTEIESSAPSSQGNK